MFLINWLRKHVLHNNILIVYSKEILFKTLNSLTQSYKLLNGLFQTSGYIRIESISCVQTLELSPIEAFLLQYLLSSGFTQFNIL